MQDGVGSMGMTNRVNTVWSNQRLSAPRVRYKRYPLTPPVILVVVVSWVKILFSQFLALFWHDYASHQTLFNELDKCLGEAECSIPGYSPPWWSDEVVIIDADNASQALGATSQPSQQQPASTSTQAPEPSTSCPATSNSWTRCQHCHDTLACCTTNPDLVKKRVKNTGDDACSQMFV